MTPRKVALVLTTLFVAGFCFSRDAHAAFTLNTTNATSVQGIWRTSPPANCTSNNCDGWLYKDDNSDPSVWSQNPTETSHYCAQILNSAYCNLVNDNPPHDLQTNIYGGDPYAYASNGLYHWFESVGYWPGAGGCNGDTTWQACASEGDGVEEADFTIGASPSLSVNFIFPTNGTTTADFNNWEIDVENLGSIFSPYVRIFYGDTTSSLAFQDEGIVDTGENDILKNNLLPYNKIYYAYIDLYNQVGQVAASSSVISFTISGGAITPTSTIQVVQGACNYTSSSFLADPIGNIQQGICNSFAYLFLPSTSQQGDLQARIGNIKTSVATKPPFGYISSIIAAFASSSASTSTVLVNASTSAAFSPFLGAVDGMIGFLLGLVFAWWLFHRARHFEFH